VVVYAHLVAVHRPQGRAYDFSHTRMGLVTSVKLLDDPGVAAILENNRGTAQLRVGTLPSARQHLERAVARLPDYAPVQGNLGIALLRSGDAAAASARFEKALRLAPDDPSTLFNIASLYRQAGRVGDALALLRKADLGSASPWLLLARGDLEMSQGDIGAALRSYRKAASRSPELVEPLLAIARAEKARGNDVAARRALDKALALSNEEAKNLVSDVVPAPEQNSDWLGGALGNRASGGRRQSRNCGNQPFPRKIKVKLLRDVGYGFGVRELREGAQEKFLHVLLEQRELRGIHAQRGRVALHDGALRGAIGVVDPGHEEARLHEHLGHGAALLDDGSGLGGGDLGTGQVGQPELLDEHQLPLVGAALAVGDGQHSAGDRVGLSIGDVDF
jgi:Flp pilus assembly protein TadD